MGDVAALLPLQADLGDEQAEKPGRLDPTTQAAG